MKLSERLAEARDSLTYHTEGAILEFTDELIRLMDARNMSRADLATAIGSSPAYITKVLGGNANFTLATMTKLARALEATVHVQLKSDIPSSTTNRQHYVVPTPAPVRPVQQTQPGSAMAQVDSFAIERQT